MGGNNIFGIHDLFPNNNQSDIGAPTSTWNHAYISKLIYDDRSSTDRNWRTGVNILGNHLDFEYENTPGSNAYTALYRLNGSGTPSNNSDLITKGYADATYATATSGGVSQTSGSFTPILTTSTVSPYTYNVEYAFYVKTGQTVYIELSLTNINTSNVGSPGGTIQITGLPFPVTTGRRNGLSIAAVNGFDTPFYYINAVAIASHIEILYQFTLDGSLISMFNTSISNGSLMISGMYRTDQ